EQLTGVNVIARNLADPFNDFTSYITGQLTRNDPSVGPDGSYVFHGLTPGATYGVYIDNLGFGSFPVPQIFNLPGPEEWYNGANESGHGVTDNRCAWTGIPAASGATTTANITFNRVKGAPSIDFLLIQGGVTNCNGDGSLMIGSSPEPDHESWT